VQGNPLEIPLLKLENPARVIDYQSQGKNVYLKDMGFDSDGNPAFLYIRSNGHEPGPVSAPYEWCITWWDSSPRISGGKKWHTSVITESDHNYDMGSLYISETDWKIVAPTVSSPQKWGVGGELEIWQSTDKGTNWSKIRELTKNSRYNHAYVRRPVDYKAPFCFFWADGHPHEFSKSELYFGDFDGNVWKLTYTMNEENKTPEQVFFQTNYQKK